LHNIRVFEKQLLLGRILVYYELGKEQIEREIELNEDSASSTNGEIDYAEAGQAAPPAA
jgi:hypothetical protein